MTPLMTPDLLRRAASRPDAPKRLTRAADAVRDGKFSWEEVAAGTADHPVARSLLSGKAMGLLIPLLEKVSAETDPVPGPVVSRCGAPVADEDFSDYGHVVADVFENSATRSRRT